MIKYFLVFAFLLIISEKGKAQETFITWKANTPLSWKDFSGKADSRSSYDAETSQEVRYTYTFNSLNDFKFDVKAVFHQQKSWIRDQSKTEELLKHEQLHFDIAQLQACKLKLALESFSYTSNFKEEIETIANLYKQEYNLLQKLYDEETNHSVVVNKQKQWEALISSQLKLAESIVAKAPLKANVLHVLNIGKN